ncbi:MAG: tetratricopeptide repeat protein [Pirellulales bacterium]|nr:tetratricopeptide repeat protein [Pirellulales bacterium]
MATVYLPILGHDFQTYDDPENLLANPYLVRITPAKVLHFWVRPYAQLYIPLTYTFWATEALVSQRWFPDARYQGLNPVVFHSGSLVLHAGCTWLVYAILRQLNIANWSSWLGAMIFGLHPLHVESVAWITETKGLLSGLFALLAIWFYLRAFGCDWNVEVSTRRTTSAVCYGTATVAFVLSMLAKPSTVIVPLIVAALDIGFVGRPWRRVWLAVAPWLVVATVIIWLTRVAQPESASGYVTPVWLRPIVAGDALTSYLKKLVLPIELTPDYGRSPRLALSQPTTYLYALLAFVLPLALWLLPRRRELLTCLAVFVVALLPSLGFLPFAFQNFSTVADRYAYLALLGPSLLAAQLAVPTRGGVVISAAVVGLATLSALSVFAVAHWSRPAALYHHMLAINPRSYLAENALGNIAAEQGRFAHALAHYQHALKLDGSYVAAHVNAGVALTKLDRLDEATTAYRAALAIDPNAAEAYRGLAVCFAQQGKVDEAIKQLEYAIRLDPTEASAHQNLAILLGSQRQYAQAIEQFLQALELSGPQESLYFGLGTAQARLGAADDALISYRQALALRPDSLEIANALAWHLATSQALTARDGRRAIELALQACRATHHRNAAYLDTLAAAYAEAGQFDEAIQVAGLAAQVANAESNNDLAEAIVARLELYRRQQPFRASVGP